MANMNDWNTAQEIAALSLSSAPPVEGTQRYLELMGLAEKYGRGLAEIGERENEIRSNGNRRMRRQGLAKAKKERLAITWAIGRSGVPLIWVLPFLVSFMNAEKAKEIMDGMEQFDPEGAAEVREAIARRTVA